MKPSNRSISSRRTLNCTGVTPCLEKVSLQKVSHQRRRERRRQDRWWEDDEEDCGKSVSTSGNLPHWNSDEFCWCWRLLQARQMCPAQTISSGQTYNNNNKFKKNTKADVRNRLFLDRFDFLHPCCFSHFPLCSVPVFLPLFSSVSV